jgi:hypothetical protein
MPQQQLAALVLQLRMVVGAKRPILAMLGVVLSVLRLPVKLAVLLLVHRHGVGLVAFLLLRL